MSAGRSLTYEVYYLQQGRWQIHARFKHDERDEAIEECKRLDTQGFQGSCVVRESYSRSTGEMSESVVYHSPRLKGKPAIGAITGNPDSGGQKNDGGGGAKGGGGASGGGGGGGGRGRSVMEAPEGSAAANAAKEAKKRREEEARIRAEQELVEAHFRAANPPPRIVETEEIDLGALLPRLIFGFIIAVIVGTAVAAATYYGLRYAAIFGIVVGRGVSESLIIGAWVLGFGASFVPLVKKAMQTSRTKVRREVNDQGAGQGGGAASDVRAAAAEIAASASSAAAAAAGVGGGGDEQRAAIKRAELQALEAEKLPSFDFSDFDEDEDEDDGATGDASVEAIEKAPSEKAKSANENLAADEPPPDILEPALDRLVKEALSVCGAALANDHYLRFGMILFVAGAAESLGRRCKVDQQTLVNVLATRIEGLGAPKQHALGFAANIDEYLIEQRYFEMYAKGRGAGVKVGQNIKSASGMPEAVKFWKTPKASQGSATPGAASGDGEVIDDKQAGASNSFVAVMFTDIADSTHKQQTMGDEWLMNVVRAHNDICREALSVHSGREIKHTGDGIMATFPTVTDSVEAAMAMQDGFKRFSKAMPDLAFRVRVGISAGEPIHESGDVFGTPVNLAARVLSKTEADEVWVSEIVKSMCEGKSYVFSEAGRFELKGFDTPQPIYKVVDRRKKIRSNGAASKAA